MTNQNLPFPTDADAPQTKANGKPIAIVNLQAEVLELPVQRTIGNDVLYKTYCNIKTAYRPFNTDIYSVNKPDVQIGDVIDIQIRTSDYKLRFKKAE